MRLIRSLSFALLFYALTTMIVLVGLPIALFSRKGISRVAHHWGRLYLILARATVGVRMKVEGTLPDGPVLVAAKHESAYETLALLAILDEPIIVLKRELAAIPLFGTLIRRHGVIPVDRAASATALRSMLLAADDAKTRHRVVLIFPEGTRVPHGEAPKLQAGFAGLYARLGMPVIPVATDAGIVWPRGLMKQPGIVTLRFGETIPSGLPRKAIEAAVHDAINVLNG
ncbi:lysophospholipid acyltransferase family protein [Sphingomonas abietis]|uniref:Lysophospholipid acyltransferase family protein n=1 Tax=Sphingomonas abietis TaxID=3012344 RepID=A0ABY7NMA1_9SPHN|nr:lysophospholipid acyltransferase family protein [Sphingomonas abietis]WBO22661.1 lysophospholipid acyltransferase family protein [Sphingomonas abietis]